MVESTKLLTAPAVFLVSWLLFGVYEIGYSIEDPFQGTLRLSVLCDTVRRDVLADEVIRNTAFDGDCMRDSSSSHKTSQQASTEEQDGEDVEYELSPPVKTKDKLSKSKEMKFNTTSTIVEELPVLPSKAVIWEGSKKGEEVSKRP